MTPVYRYRIKEHAYPLCCDNMALYTHISRSRIRPRPTFFCDRLPFLKLKLNSLFISVFRFPDVRRVHFEEKMDIYCPLDERGSQASSDSHHFQIIWLVDKESYESCTLNEVTSRRVRTRFYSSKSD